jgi:hypothetical protein
VGGTDRTTKVKSGGGHAQGTPLKGLRFETFAAAQTYLGRSRFLWTLDKQEVTGVRDEHDDGTPSGRS